MRPWLLFAVTLGSVSFTEGLLAPSASACAAIPPGVLSTIPAAGTKTYPANAAIRLNDEGLSVAGLSATVGGKPAVVVAREGAVPPLGLALDLQPAPAPGELVTVAGALCKKGNNAPFSCAIDIAYTASEADKAAPAPAPAVSYDVHDYVDFKSSGGDCQSDSDLALWVNLPAPTDVAPYELQSTTALDRPLTLPGRKQTRCPADPARPASREREAGRARAGMAPMPASRP